MYITAAGYKKLQEDLRDLEEKRKPAVRELSIARDMGDRSENAAYKSARQKLSALDRRITHLKITLRNSEVVERKKKDVVEIGGTVTLTTDGQRHEYTVVGTYESDIESGKISYISPLGRNLLGKKVGQTFFVQTPSGIKKYEILAII